MNAKYQNMITQLQQLKEQMELLAQNQQEIRREFRMIFSDISHFENLVLKILDHNQAITIKSDEFHN